MARAYLKRTKKIFVWGLAAIFFLLFLIWGFIQTPYAKEKISDWVSGMEIQGYSFSLTGLNGFLPIDWGFGELSVRDDKGELFRIKDFQFSWSPWMLVYGKVEINRIKADRLRLNRLPERKEERGSEPDPADNLPGLELPEYMPGVEVAGMDFPSIILSKRVLGERAEFSLNSHLEFESLERMKAGFELFRTDKSGIATTCSFEYASDNLNIKYKLSGGEEGLLNRYTSPVLKSPLQVSLQGKGPVQGWSGNMQVESGKTQILESDIFLGKSGDDVDLECKGSINPAVDRIVVLKEIDYPFREDISFSLEVNLKNQEAVEISEFVLTTSGIRISTRGTADTVKGDFDTDWNIFLARLNNIPGIKDSGISGSLDCRAELKGNWESRQLSSRVGIDLEKIKGIPEQAEGALGDTLVFRSKLDWQEGNILQFAKTGLASGQVDISSNGQVDLNDLGLDVNWKLGEIGLVSVFPGENEDMQGSLRASGNINGTPRALAAETLVELSGASFASVKPLSASIRTRVSGLPSAPRGDLELDIDRNGRQISGQMAFSWVDERLDLHEMHMEFPDGYLSADGYWSVHRALGDLSAQAHMGSLSWVQDFWPVELKGEVDLNATLANRDQGMGLATEGKIRDFSYLGINIYKALFNADLSDLSELDGEFGVNADKIALGENLIEKFTLEGNKSGDLLDLDLAARGNYGRDFQLDLSGQYVYASNALSLGRGKGRYASMPFSWEKPVDIAFPAKELAVQGEDIHIAGGEMDVDFSVRKDVLQGKMSLASVDISMLPVKQTQNLEGDLDADLVVSGSKASPRMELACDVSEVQAVKYIQEPEEPINVSLQGKYSQNNMALNVSIFKLEEEILSGKLDIPASFSLEPFQFEPETGMQGKLRSNLDLKWVTQILAMQGQLLTGDLVLDVDIAGSLFDPAIAGDIKLRNGSYEYADTGTYLQDIYMQCKLKEEGLRITEFTSSAGEEGKLNGEGSLQFAGEQGLEYTFALNLDNANLYNTELVQGRISGNLDVQGSSDKTTISGDLKIFPMELGIPEPGPKGLSDLEIVEVSSRESEKEGEETPPESGNKGSVLSRIFLDIGIDIPGGMYIRGRGMESEWSGNLRIRGSLDNLSINGEMQVVRGNMNILGKRFTFQRGEVTFTDQLPPKPYFEILAVHKRSSLTVNLFLSGTTDDFSIKLSSDPTYPRDEILSRLLFGKGVSQITALEAVKLAWSIRQITSGSSGMMGDVRNFLQVDMLQIKSAEEGEGTTVGVGKYLNEDVYFEVEKGVQGETGRITVSVELTPRFSLQSVYGSMNQGVTFNWEYQY